MHPRYYLILPLLLLLVQLSAQTVSLQPDSSYTLDILQKEIKKSISNGNLKEVALAHYLMGVQYERIYNTSEKALDSYVRSLGMFQTLHDSTNIFRAQTAIGNYYTRLQLFDEAIKMYEEALPFYHRTSDFKGLAYTYANISDAYAAVKDQEKAEKYISLASQASQIAKDSILGVKMLLRQSAKFREKEQIDSARLYALRASLLSKNLNFGLGISQSEYEYGRINRTEGNLAAAIQYFRSSLQHDPDTMFTFRRCQTYRDLADCHYDLGEFDRAFEYLRQYSDLKDSLLSTQQMALVDQKAMQFEASKKEESIQRLQDQQKQSSSMLLLQKIIIWITLFLILAALITGYFLVRSYQHRLKANQIIIQQQEEINLRKISDLENNLKIETMNSMIQGQEAERERIARDLHDSLGGMLSTAKLQLNALGHRLRNTKESPEYQKAYELVDESCREVRTIAHQMQPNALTKLGLVPALNDLISKIEIADAASIDFQHYGIEEAKITPPVALTAYRIAQELLTNAIKHANAKHILVQVGMNDEQLSITVEDDGCGFDVLTPARGMGLDNITTRVNYLKGDLSIHSVPGEGTSFLITIPILMAT